jgi:CubicO group peptidase (beta-lactamase class C family)
LPTGVDVFDATQGWGLFSAVQRAESPAQPGHVGLFSWGGAATTSFFADPSEELLALVFAQHLPYDEPQLFGAFRKAVFAALAETRAKP